MREETHLGQVPQVVGVEQQLLETPSVSANLLGHHGERAVALVDVLDLPVAALEDRDALEHDGSGSGGGGEELKRRPEGRTDGESQNTTRIGSTTAEEAKTVTVATTVTWSTSPCCTLLRRRRPLSLLILSSSAAASQTTRRAFPQSLLHTSSFVSSLAVGPLSRRPLASGGLTIVFVVVTLSTFSETNKQTELTAAEHSER